jgi:hypothetical protein
LIVEAHPEVGAKDTRRRGVLSQPPPYKKGLQDRAHSARGQFKSGYNSDVKLAIFQESTQEPDEPLFFGDY